MRVNASTGYIYMDVDLAFACDHVCAGKISSVVAPRCEMEYAARLMMTVIWVSGLEKKASANKNSNNP